MFTIHEVTQGVRLYTLPTQQFKTITVSIKFATALTSQVAGTRTVLSNIMQYSNQITPSNRQFRQRLDELYGASIYLDTTKRGDEHYLHLNADFINDTYLNEESITEEVLKMLHAVLFKPSFLSSNFDDSILEREKKQVVSRIDSLYEDKARYAQHRLLQKIRPNHPASITSTGTKNDVEPLTVEELLKTYHSMMSWDEISIYVVGDIDSEKWSTLVSNYFPFEARSYNSTTQISEHVAVDGLETIEAQDMKQGKLHIAFETDINSKSAEFPAMQILNGVFGAYPHSKLFTNVREKESLAYYASSSFASSYGLLFATSGIDPSQKDKAESLIEQQLVEIQQGNISDLEFVQTKSMLKNQLQEIRDSARGMIEVYDSYKDIDPEFTLDAWIQKWSSVTKDQISDLAKGIHKIHTYFLTAKEGNQLERTQI